MWVARNRSMKLSDRPYCKTACIYCLDVGGEDGVMSQEGCSTHVDSCPLS